MKKLLVLTLVFFSLFFIACNKDITITFVYDDSSEQVVIPKGTSCEPLNLSIEGYTLAGWYYEETLDTKYNDEVLEKDTTLYAKLDINKYTVTFKNGSTELKKEEVEYNKSATAPNEPTKVGYDFSGWDKSFENVKSDLIVNAVWNIQELTVVFYDGEEVIATQKIEYSSKVTLPADPEQAGKEFVGWVLKDGTIFDENQSITKDLEIYADYQDITFEVIFKNGNAVVKTEIVAYGQGATAPEDPSKNGYDFEKWDISFAEIFNDLVINAVFKPIIYDISYFDGATKLTHTPNSFTIEDSITLTAYNKTGFEFLGWYDNSAFTGNAVSVLAVGSTDARTLYGKWFDESNIKTLEFELNGGSFTWVNNAITDVNAGIGSDSELPMIFAQDFYTYLKDNDLLSSSTINSVLRVNNWTSFMALNPNHNGDPVKIWCDTSTNTSAMNDGYCQFLFNTATGNSTTGEILTISGGFLGTEPYKSKYWQLTRHLAYMLHIRYQGNELWSSASSKSLCGFIIDGYFEGTQSAGTTASLRNVIPNTNEGYKLNGTVVEKFTTDYGTVRFVGQDVLLPAPSRLGYVFRGWYDNVGLTGEPISQVLADETPAAKYYAKWEAIS